MKLSRDFIYIVIIAILLAALGQLIYSYKYTPAKERAVQVFYNQDIQANRKIIETIQDADKFVYFAVYTFTRTDIKDALLGAKHRGLEVRGITDRDQIEKIDLQEKIIKELRDAGIPVATQDHAAIMHLKTVVTDKGYVSGSYNWTAAATSLNDEVIEVGRDESIRKQYQSVLEELLQKYQD
jgi:phosphatidylserine/phosphatidylglycerophosphate/cardiolipin synthase-like enzyme